jgi:molybdopterin converting factor small subunit
MRVTIKLIGPLIYAAGFSEKEIRLPCPATAQELLSRIKLEKGRPTIITRNGKAVSLADALKDGDRVVISPIYSGG